MPRTLASLTPSQTDWTQDQHIGNQLTRTTRRHPTSGVRPKHAPSHDKGSLLASGCARHFDRSTSYHSSLHICGQAPLFGNATLHVNASLYASGCAHLSAMQFRTAMPAVAGVTEHPGNTGNTLGKTCLSCRAASWSCSVHATAREISQRRTSSTSAGGSAEQFAATDDEATERSWRDRVASSAFCTWASGTLVSGLLSLGPRSQDSAWRTLRQKVCWWCSLALPSCAGAKSLS